MLQWERTPASKNVDMVDVSWLKGRASGCTLIKREKGTGSSDFGGRGH